MITSGTTGHPKEAFRSHRGASLLSLLTEIEIGIHRSDGALLVMPMCHANSLYFFGAFSYCGGTTTIYSRKSFDPEHCVRTLAEGGSTFSSLVPTHYAMMLGLPAAVRERYDLDRVTKLMISSAPARPETKRAVMEMFRGSGLFELYGATEIGWVTMLHPEEQFTKLGSVGRECVGSAPITLLDGHGQEVPDGEPGELYSCTPYTFDGYWKLPEKTAEAFQGEHCTVGDMARRDADGYIHLVDRKSSMIISGDERAAVHMAQAHAELTGELGVALVTAGSGVTNAHVSRASVLVISGTNPTPQENRGGLQDLDHTLEEHLRPKPHPITRPDPARIAEAVDLLWSAQRVLVISGRGARGAGPELVALLDRLGAVYLDTGESRGLVPDTHPAVVGAMRGAVMGGAEIVLTAGRRLDFQLAYGSPAVFGQAQFVRIADVPAELRDNRRGAVELLASPAEALSALVEAAGNRSASVDQAWTEKLRAGHEERVRKLRQAMATAPPGSDGRLHPNRVIAALQDAMGPEAIVVTDGGDFLSFARIGLSAASMLDPGSFGCIGVGVPYGIAASLAFPDRPVVVATGDGAFGFNAIEVDTAVRHSALVLIVGANNGAWQIEVHDQTVTHGKVIEILLLISPAARHGPPKLP